MRLDILRQHQHRGARARALGAAERGWSALTWLVAAASLLVAVGFILASDDLGEWSLAVTGALLLPGWLAWSARRLPAATVGEVDATVGAVGAVGATAAGAAPEAVAT